MARCSGPGAPTRIAVLLVIFCAALLAATASFAQTVSQSWGFASIGITGPGPLPAAPSIQCRGNDCALSIASVGTGIGGTADEFTFAYVAFTGDGELVTRVDSLTRTDDEAKAGLMIRESLDPGASHAFAFVSGDGTLAFQGRPATNGISENTPAGGAPGQVWLKLVRVGATFTAYRSPDGTIWNKFASDTIAMGATVFAGLAVTSHNPGLPATAQFSAIELTAFLPAGWQTSDIAGPAGGATFYSDGAFFLRSSGADIGGARDQFRYAFEVVSGDVDITARLSSIQGIDPATKAGPMIRSSLTPTAAHASVLGTLASGVAFKRRALNDGASAHDDGGPLSGPVWLKLERRGDRITAFRSNDGLSWTFVGDETVTLPEDVYVGLALASHAPWVASATFDHVTIQGIPSNASPTISLTAPSPGTQAKPGESVALAATASDSDGSVAAVDFLVNGTVLTSVSSTPYAATWTPTAAGTFTVTANARDNAGAIATSNAASVSIQADAAASPNPGPAPAPPSRTLTFTASADDATLVAFYQLEIFQSGGSATAVVVQNLGKPASLAGEISVDVTMVVAQLPPGSYVAVVNAVGAGGAGRSDPSPAFPR